jgi:dTDP-4-amino-4,6-dideoxygalactose transaminase
MEPVKFLDLAKIWSLYEREIKEEFSNFVRDGIYIGGEQVTSFERKWANYIGCSYTVGSGNGLDALSSALHCLGVGPGDEVIVPSNTYVATWLAVIQVGATPIAVDANWKDFLINVEKIEEVITHRTKLILPVHMYGLACDIDNIVQLAKNHNLLVLDDAAQSHGTLYKGKMIGSCGCDATAWSFYPGKTLGALGDAGGVTTNSNDLAQCLRMYGNYGALEKYNHEIAGVNSRLDPFQAIALSVRLKYLDTEIEKRRIIANIYFTNLRGIVHIPNNYYSRSSYHLFPVWVENREKLIAAFNANNIDFGIHYPIALNSQPALSKYNLLNSPQFEVSEKIAQGIISLPISPVLEKTDALRIVEIIRKSVGHV